MSTEARLLYLNTAGDTDVACIQPQQFWPDKSVGNAWIWGAGRPRWSDFLNSSRTDSDFEAHFVVSGRVIADLLEARLADGYFTPLNMHAASVQYFLFTPRAEISMRHVDVTAKVGGSEQVFSWVPDYEEFKGNAFVSGKMAGTGILCIPEILSLAKAKKWTGVRIQALAQGSPRYECSHRCKITEDMTPHPSLVDDYYACDDVISADLERARVLATQFQNSPDMPEATRRSFEIVRKALVEAPHTLGYPDSKPAKPRVFKPGAPLLAPKAIKGLKLEGDGELIGEIELGRLLFGANTLSVIVSDDAVDDAPEVSFTKTEMKRRAQAILEKLESRLPIIDATIDAQAAAYEKSPADFRAILHDPGIFLCTADMTKGERWTFTIEDDLVGHHFEFDGDKLIEVWSGD